MYGSSWRMETERPRALRMRPMLAAVIPLPSEEVTPPVTKTYFDMVGASRGFFECCRKWPQRAMNQDELKAGNVPARTDGRGDVPGVARADDAALRRGEGQRRQLGRG